MEITLNVDMDKLRSDIENAPKIDDNEKFFEQLTALEITKKQIKDALDQLSSLESEAKGLINAKAKALYGPDWQTISGEHFKITRSSTGDIYTINGTPSAKFTKVKVTVDSKAVEEYIVEHDKLPKGIEINPSRGESLRITIK